MTTPNNSFLRYIDIKILPNAEIPVATMMGELYTRLHHRLVQMRTDQIAVSFPQCREEPVTIGDTIRIIGPDSVLRECTTGTWMKRFMDFARISDIQSVPDNVEWKNLNKVRGARSVDSERRRYKKRFNVSDPDVIKKIPDRKIQPMNMPFLWVRSTSTGQNYPLFFRITKSAQDNQREWTFNSFGLSKTSEIPWF